jgi:hypothetical protein
MVVHIVSLSERSPGLAVRRNAAKSGASVQAVRTLTSRNLIFASSEFGNIVTGVFAPVLAKHSKSFNLVDTLSVGVDRIQRNLEPVQRQVESWRHTQITDTQAKLIFHSAFVGLLPDVDRQYFEPEYFGVLAANDVELVERVHQRFQEARSGSAVQGDARLADLYRETPLVLRQRVGGGKSFTANYGSSGERLLPSSDG